MKNTFFVLCVAVCVLVGIVTPVWALHINPQYGKITDENVGSRTTMPQVYVIEDAHCHPEVQKNIVSLLRGFIDDSPEKILVGIEGAYFGKLETKSLHVFDDPERNTIVFDEMFMSGKLSAAEYLHVTDGGFYLYGLEESDVYKSNLSRYAAYIDQKEKQQIDLQSCEEMLVTIKDLVLTERYRDFEKQIDAFYANKNSEFIVELQFLADLYAVAFPAGGILETMVTVQTELGALDEKQLSQDVARIERLLDSPVSLEGTREQFAEGVRSLDDFFVLKKYFLLREKLNDIRFEDILHELRSVQERIQNAMVIDDDERELLLHMRNFEKVKKILTLTVTPEEYAAYCDSIGNEYMQELELYLQSYRPQFQLQSDYDAVFNARDTFYAVAKKRDAIMIDNAMQAIDELSLGEAHTVVLIIGGFHTRGVIANLKKRDLSYAIIRPTITTNEKEYEDTYFQVLKESTVIFGE